MTLFQIICFSFATVMLTINILIIMIQVRKQRNQLLVLFLKLAELEQKLESKLPLIPTIPSEESTPEPATPTSSDPVPTEPESSEESTTSKQKPYGITYKVVSQAEKMVRDVEETVQLTGISKNKIYPQADGTFVLLLDTIKDAGYPAHIITKTYNTIEEVVQYIVA